MNNPCVECGKQRIDGKSWEEKSGMSLVTHTQTVCPDSVCQKIVDKAIAERKAKIKNLALKKAQSKLDREKQVAVGVG